MHITACTASIHTHHCCILHDTITDVFHSNFLSLLFAEKLKNGSEGKLEESAQFSAAFLPLLPILHCLLGFICLHVLVACDLLKLPPTRNIISLPPPSDLSLAFTNINYTPSHSTAQPTISLITAIPFNPPSRWGAFNINGLRRTMQGPEQKPAGIEEQCILGVNSACLEPKKTFGHIHILEKRKFKWTLGQ